MQLATGRASLDKAQLHLVDRAQSLEVEGIWIARKGALEAIPVRQGPGRRVTRSSELTFGAGGCGGRKG